MAPINQLGLWVTLINIQFRSRCGGSEKSGFQKSPRILKSITFHTHGENGERKDLCISESNKDEKNPTTQVIKITVEEPDLNAL